MSTALKDSATRAAEKRGMDFSTLVRTLLLDEIERQRNGRKTKPKG